MRSSKSCHGGAYKPRPWLAVALACASLAAPGADALSAQELVRTDVEENVRAAPQGGVLGRLRAGVALERLGETDGWSEVRVEGWVWTRSLQATSRDDFGLVVSASEGENLRDGPAGEVVGRLEFGTLLEELATEPGWTRVRRTAWVWSPSVSVVRAAAPASATEGSGSAGPPEDRFVRIARRAPILGAPDGDTLAWAAGPGDFEVLARQGGWVRVRLEGWAWRPESSDSSVAGAVADEAAEAALTPQDLVAPGGEGYEGRRVRWRVQFVSLERAEAVRTDFYEGEPFLLARYEGAGGPFVYVAVPPDRIDLVDGLTPLEMVTVTGRVRRAASALTGTPIVDLLALDRGRGR